MIVLCTYVVVKINPVASVIMNNVKAGINNLIQCMRSVFLEDKRT